MPSHLLLTWSQWPRECLVHLHPNCLIKWYHPLVPPHPWACRHHSHLRLYSPHVPSPCFMPHCQCLYMSHLPMPLRVVTLAEEVLEELAWGEVVGGGGISGGSMGGGIRGGGIRGGWVSIGGGGCGMSECFVTHVGSILIPRELMYDGFQWVNLLQYLAIYHFCRHTYNVPF